MSEESPASLAIPSIEERGVPDVAGDVRAPRSEESLASLVMTEHRGARSPRRRRRGPSTDVTDDVRAVKCAHLVLEHEETERRGVPGVDGDEARATNNLVNWSAVK